MMYAHKMFVVIELAILRVFFGRECAHTLEGVVVRVDKMEVVCWRGRALHEPTPALCHQNYGLEDYPLICPRYDG